MEDVGSSSRTSVVRHCGLTDLSVELFAMICSEKSDPPIIPESASAPDETTKNPVVKSKERRFLILAINLTEGRKKSD